MSKETKMDIDYVSKLARIDLLPDEKDKFQAQLGDVLQYFEKSISKFILPPLWEL